MHSIKIRKVRKQDRESLAVVESKSTPNLRYVPHVFDQFMADERGEFIAAEIDGEVVGCAKFTVTPNNSAWLETLRVIPERQGLGIGKCLYQRFFEIAAHEKIKSMRMYTGIRNAVSKGLAEHAGFQLDATFCGFSLKCQPLLETSTVSTFRQVKDAKRATELLMAHCSEWNDFLVMNRTFYKLTPDLSVYLTEKGDVYEDLHSDSVIAMGARFMPEQALHIGLFAGDHEACLQFAMQKGVKLGVDHLSCLSPYSAEDTHKILADYHFQPNPSAFIVMKADV